MCTYMDVHVRVCACMCYCARVHSQVYWIQHLSPCVIRYIPSMLCACAPTLSCLSALEACLEYMHLPYALCRYMLLWITLSAGVILLNKYVLSFSGFPYPISLTCSHMLFCSGLAAVMVRLGWAEVRLLCLITCPTKLGIEDRRPVGAAEADFGVCVGYPLRSLPGSPLHQVPS